MVLFPCPSQHGIRDGRSTSSPSLSLSLALSLSLCGILHCGIDLLTRLRHSGDSTLSMIMKAQGSVLFLEEGALVPPITEFCEESISVGSQGLVLR